MSEKEGGKERPGKNHGDKMRLHLLTSRRWQQSIITAAAAAVVDAAVDAAAATAMPPLSTPVR